MNARIKKIIATLNKTYPDPRPFLNFRTPFESVVATILSAQCTDLFKAAPTPQRLLALGEKKLMSYIRSTGFYRAKAKNLRGMAAMLIEKYSGCVPCRPKPKCSICPLLLYCPTGKRRQS